MSPATRLMVEKLTTLAAQGLTYKQAADEIGSSYHYVARFASCYGIPLVQLQRGPKVKLPDERSEDMRVRYVGGETLIKIGESYGVTRERVRQLLTKYYGIRAKDGGKSEATRNARKAFQKKRDARSQRVWGCSYRDYQRILKHPDKPTYAYWAQRKNALVREIGWELNLWQWWKLWEQSGHWAERGRGRGYGMCRQNDKGPYSVDNIYIATGVDNMKDYWVNKRADAAILEAAE